MGLFLQSRNNNRILFGDTITKEQANFDNDTEVPAGSYPAHACGIHDMHGNVLEWVEDGYYFSTEEPRTDPLNTEHQFGRMYRGGFYDGQMETLLSSRRIAHHKSMSYENYGFRIACPVQIK